MTSFVLHSKPSTMQCGVNKCRHEHSAFKSKALNAASEMLKLGQVVLVKQDYNMIVYHEKKCGIVWFMCCKHSQTECLLKNPLIG